MWSRGNELFMRKALLVSGLSLMLFVITACQSAESKELLDYHNDFVVNIGDKMDELVDRADKMWEVETEEEAVEAIDNGLEPYLNELKEYMDAQDPQEDVTKEYHKMRLDSFNALYESMELSMEAFRGIVSEEMDDDELDDLFEKSIEKNDEADKLAQEANQKFGELSEEYNFEQG